MLHSISFPTIAKIYNVHYYLKVASDDLGLILFSLVVCKLIDHEMSFLQSSSSLDEGI